MALQIRVWGLTGQQSFLTTKLEDSVASPVQILWTVCQPKSLNVYRKILSAQIKMQTQTCPITVDVYQQINS